MGTGRPAPRRAPPPLRGGAHRAALAAPEAPRPPSVTQGHDLDGEGVLASPRLRSIPYLRSIFGPHGVPPQGRVASLRAVAGRRRGLSPGDGVAAYRSNVEHTGASPWTASVPAPSRVTAVSTSTPSATSAKGPPPPCGCARRAPCRPRACAALWWA